MYNFKEEEFLDAAAVQMLFQDAWEVAGEMDELMARVEYSNASKADADRLAKLQDLIKASAGYKALIAGDASFFDHLSEDQVYVLFNKGSFYASHSQYHFENVLKCLNSDLFLSMDVLTQYKNDFGSLVSLKDTNHKSGDEKYIARHITYNFSKEGQHKNRKTGCLVIKNRVGVYAEYTPEYLSDILNILKIEKSEVAALGYNDLKPASFFNGNLSLIANDIRSYHQKEKLQKEKWQAELAAELAEANARRLARLEAAKQVVETPVVEKESVLVAPDTSADEGTEFLDMLEQEVSEEVSAAPAAEIVEVVSVEVTVIPEAVVESTEPVKPSEEPVYTPSESPIDALLDFEVYLCEKFNLDPARVLAVCNVNEYRIARNEQYQKLAEQDKHFQMLTDTVFQTGEMSEEELLALVDAAGDAHDLFFFNLINQIDACLNQSTPVVETEVKSEVVQTADESPKAQEEVREEEPVKLVDKTRVLARRSDLLNKRKSELQINAESRAA